MTWIENELVHWLTIIICSSDSSKAFLVSFTIKYIINTMKEPWFVLGINLWYIYMRWYDFEAQYNSIIKP